MIRSIVKLLSVAFTVLVLFSSVAQADSLFRLRIEDLATGQGVVITDGGIGDVYGSTPGMLAFSGSLGSFVVNVTIGVSSPVIGGVNNYAELDLFSMNVSGAGPGSLRITLEDTGYTGGANGAIGVTSLVGGTLTAPAGSSVTFESWANGSNLVPDLGADAASPTLLAAIGSMPAGSVAVFSPATTFGPGAFSDTGSAAFTKSGSYSLFSQATLVFTGAGMVSFDQNTSVNLPEPTSLLLLGTGLAGLGLLGRKRKQKQAQDQKQS